MGHVFNMWMLAVARIFSLANRLQAPVQQLHTYRHASEAVRSRFISASPIAFILPVTGFLILLINCTEAELVVKLRGTGLV